MVHTVPISYFHPPHLRTHVPVHVHVHVHVRVVLATTSTNNPFILRTGATHNQRCAHGNINRGMLLHCNNQTAVATTTPTDVLESASNVVIKFYGGINARDLTSVEDLIAPSCVYEDLIFPRPFVGRKAILEFFKQFMDSISTDLQFAIDDISEEDSSAVGVTWHLEWDGKSFPFSKGCSFYRLDVIDGQRQITYGRDIVEPAIKPGETALVAIRGVTWLLQKFPFLADRL